MRSAAFFAMAILLAAGAVGATPTVTATPIAAASSKAPRRVAHIAPAARRALTTASATSVDGTEGWAAVLGPVEVLNRNTNGRAAILLYDAHGTLDRGQALAFMHVAGVTSDGASSSSSDDWLDLRLVQLAIRASYHFAGAKISIVSATRAGARGKHGSGEALDFSLEGVKAGALAAYLRTTPRAGVGIYTHPKTQYVHLDVRDHSYHWIDASPPGVTWRERLLPDPKQLARDASWSSRMDLPESPDSAN